MPNIRSLTMTITDHNHTEPWMNSFEVRKIGYFYFYQEKEKND
jgi:hypothetical protein